MVALAQARALASSKYRAHRNGIVVSIVIGATFNSIVIVVIVVDVIDIVRIHLSIVVDKVIVVIDIKVVIAVGTTQKLPTTLSSVWKSVGILICIGIARLAPCDTRRIGNRLLAVDDLSFEDEDGAACTAGAAVARGIWIGCAAETVAQIGVAFNIAFRTRTWTLPVAIYRHANALCDAFAVIRYPIHSTHR